MKATVHLNKFLSVFVCLALLLSLAPLQQAQAVSPDIVISQVYGGGGNAGATYKNDFIELYNRGLSAVDITGWTVQYASATGASWQTTVLSGIIQPGRYYLVQEGPGAGGTVNLPTPDASGLIAMSATAGKVALVSNSTALTLACPTGVSNGTATGIKDYVGFGTTANCYEGTGRAPAPSNTTADLRKSNGAQDTDDNSADFATGSPTPRNSSYPFSGAAQATPAVLVAGQTTLLTVTVNPGTSPASSGIAVSCNLLPIGGLASQTLYDDATHGDLAVGDNVFSFSTVDTVSGAQNITCNFSDAQLRSGTTSTTVTLVSILPIGTVNGPVLNTDDGTQHRSPYAPATGNGAGQFVAIQGVIYEKTLQAIAAGSPDVYYGFFIQNTSGTADGLANTSDGLFVFMNTNSTMSGPSGPYTPTVGDEVVLTGSISEYYNMTELSSPTLSSVVRSGVVLDTELPAEVVNPDPNLAVANRYWERRQAMRMQVPADSIVIGGRNVFSPADAEIWVTRPDSTVASRTNPYARRAFRDASTLDDNYDAVNWDGNGYRILMGSLGIKYTEGDGQALLVPARSFDTVTNAPVGGINYSFSKYRVEVTTQPTLSEGVDPSTNNPPYSFAPHSSYYTIADYNLENLYDYRDNPFSGCDFVGGSNTGCAARSFDLSAVTPPYDYVPASDADYQARLGDIAYQIINDLHSPDILMVQEVENQDICTATAGGPVTCGSADNADGKPDVLQDLAYKIASLGGPAYDSAFDRDSSDLRGIAPAFLFRTDRVQLVTPSLTDPVLGNNPVINYPGAPVAFNSDVSNPKTLNAVSAVNTTGCETTRVFPRAPDIGLFSIYSTSVGVGSRRDVYVINNHFKSSPDACVGPRTEQAKYNTAIVQAIQAVNPDARIVVGGDLNVYPRPDDPFAPIGQPTSSDQLGSLYDTVGLGLKNLWEVLNSQAPAAAYSYVYLGMAQTLDQMFINQPMQDSLQSFRIAHINSDFAADYPAPGDVGRGTSDHDPNVATFAFGAPTAVNLVDYSSSVLAPGGIQVQWTTVDDSQTRGFNVLRGLTPDDPNPVQVNAVEIPVKNPGSGAGASYAFADLTALPSVKYYYTLQQVSTSSATNNWGVLDYQYYKAYAPLLRR